MKFMNKKQAFTPLENEVKIPIDRSQFAFKFTKRWFIQRNLSTWSSFLPPKYKKQNKIRLFNMIQIGVCEGMDLIWCMQNILQHPDSRVLAIDPWLPTPPKIPDMEACYRRAVHNLKPWKKKVHIEKAKSEDFLPEVIKNGITISDRHIKAGEWDLIVIDGNHNAPFVFKDAIYSLKLIRKNGWMLFDDFHNKGRKKHHVQEAIGDFVGLRKDYIKLAWQHRHVVCLERTK